MPVSAAGYHPKPLWEEGILYQATHTKLGLWGKLMLKFSFSFVLLIKLHVHAVYTRSC